ncbi:MAG: hypothetical protein KBF97_01445 [Bacteroidetes bacterium]|nr:hypothetical protein [Bacteroidota bacterium]
MIFKMMMLLLPVSAGFLAAGCSGLSVSSGNPGTHYVYSYSLQQPEQRRELTFNDGSISASFTFDAAALIFDLHNLTDQQLSIVWERVSMGVNRRTYSVRNMNTFYTMGHSTPQPLTVPPKGFLRETVIPWQHVNYEHGAWIERDLFPTNDSGTQRLKGMIESSVGSEVTLVLPVRIGKVVMDYTFVFRVDSVRALPVGTAPPEKERPPMPDAPMYELSILQGYLPVMISAGILAASVIIFTQKKAPAEGL